MVLFSGFWNGAVVFDEGAAVGAMFIICAILWALAIPFSVFLFLRVILSLQLSLYGYYYYFIGT